MKHHCHCGLERYLQRFRVRKFGALGIVLMVLHVLFHVAECLVFPAILVALGGRAAEEQAAATGEITTAIIEESAGASYSLTQDLVDFQQSLQTTFLTP